MYTLHSRWMHLRLREALRVILAPAVTRRIFHAFHFLVTDTRLSGRQLPRKRSSLVVLFMAQYAHATNVVAFNGTHQIGTIYGSVVTFDPARRETWHVSRTSKEVIRALNPYAFREINSRSISRPSGMRESRNYSYILKLSEKIIFWERKGAVYISFD